MSIVNKSSQPYSGFAPTQIPGCINWLDAADTTSMTFSGSTVTQWNDKSGLGYNCTVTPGANAPVYSSSLRAIQCRAASSQSFDILQAYGDALVGKSYTIFFVGTRLASGYQYFLSGSALVANQNLLLGYSGQNDTSVELSIYGTSLYATVATYSASDPMRLLVFTSSVSPVQRQIVVDGTVGGTDAVSGTLTAFLNPRIGRRFNPNFVTYHSFDLYETITYTSALTDAQRQQIEGYLAAKWGLTSNLPSTHPFKLVRPVARPFSPLDVPGCALWLDAADSTSLTLSGSSITQWRDKSGNGRNATQTGTNCPTYVSSTKGIRFTASNTQYMLLPDGTLPSGNASYFIFIVFNPKSLPGVVYGLIYGGTVVSTNTVLGAYYMANNMNVTWQASDLTTSSSAYAVNSTNIYETSYISGGQRVQYTNGSVDGPSDTPGTRNSGTGFNRIGAFYNTNQYPLDAEIFEILVYSTLTPPQRQQIEGYLAWKWGLPSLIPTTHPFKRYPSLNVAFSPVQLSGCALWLDAADSSTFTLSGSTVTQWRDKALARAFNGSGTSTTANSYACVRFNGSQSMTSATNFSFAEVCTSGANMICFMVVNVSSSTNLHSSPFSLNFASPRFIPFYNGSGSVFFDAGIQADPRLSGTFTNNVRQIHVFSRSGNTTLQIRIDASQNASNTFTSPSSYGNQTYTGYLSPTGAGGAYIGDIHEIIYYSNEIGTANIQRIEGYLASKWRLTTNLPSSHPYKQLTP